MKRAVSIVGAAIVTLGAAAFFARWVSRPATPDSFYTAPTLLPQKPGMLLRQEPFVRRVPADAIAWRILYTTTRADDSAAVASAIVMARASTSRPRPVVVWTHGTTGVAVGCAPSLLDDPFANVPALPALLEKGWIYVATDYVGLGTPGPHPYLIGDEEARSALDSVRAVRQMQGVWASDQTVVWGHSQGGNAALWTATLAPTYSPDIVIAGVVAIAPATDLTALIDAVQHTPVGRIMSSFVLRAYSERYPDVRFEDYVSGWRGVAARDMGSRCLAGAKTLFSVAEALLVSGSIFRVPPVGGALGRRLAENTPDRTIAQPLVIAQGMADDLVIADVQSHFVARQCSAGQSLEYWRYPGRGHLSVVSADSPLVRDLVVWTENRFDGAQAPSGCSHLQR